MFKFFVILYIGTSVAHLDFPGLEKVSDDSDHKIKKTLRFNENNEFTILQLTDLHYGNSSINNLKTQALTDRLLKLVKPDLVVVTGDAISGYEWKGQGPFYRSLWKTFTDPFVKHKTFYAYVFGNHDTEADYTNQDIARLEKTHPYSLFNGDSNIDRASLSNYRLEVLSSFESRQTRPSALLWMFDTKNKGCVDVENSYGCITSNQLRWYDKASKSINKKYDQKIDGLAFFHIPTPEFINISNFDTVYGKKRELVSCPKVNTGVIAAFQKNKNIKAVFVGHDHDNDFGGDYENIELVYGRQSGYGSYGSRKAKGGRVIKLQERMDSRGRIVINHSHYIINEYGRKLWQKKRTWQAWNNPQISCDF